MMKYNQIGGTGLRLSVVGFGTCQYRLTPRRQAIETLIRGFKLGVNWVHTAPDYGGAENIIAEAVKKSGLNIHVLSNASGEMAHFKHIFENTCHILDTNRLEMFGISGIDYCESLGQNVFGPGGMVEFLKRKKEEGRLGGLFCTTHGAPDYVAKLIRSGFFDAIMLSYNPLGFHVLSYFGESEGKAYEDIKKNKETVFPLALKHKVSLLIMKPLAGGLLCPSKAFLPHKRFSSESKCLSAPDLLRYILSFPAVSAVVPGTACIEEAEENALAGHEPVGISKQCANEIEQAVINMKADLCSRCGDCESTCSKSLPISWLFREAYIWNYPSDTFEALQRLHYFHLHPDDELACESCKNRTCICTKGIDIPVSLEHVHRQMKVLRKTNLMHATPEKIEKSTIKGAVSAQVLLKDIPSRIMAKDAVSGRLWIRNAGDEIWWSTASKDGRSALLLSIRTGKKTIIEVPLRHDVGPGLSTHFVFDLGFSQTKRSTEICFVLVSRSYKGRIENETVICTESVINENHKTGSLFQKLFKRKQS